MLIDEIKKENMQALKDKDESKRTALSVVINKYMIANIEKRAEGKGFTDADLVSVLQKTIKELTEEAENYAKVNNIAEEKNILRQREIVQKFLPAMMSKEEIKAEILKLSDRSIGAVMKHFKINFAGKCDNRDVQEVLKNL